MSVSEEPRYRLRSELVGELNDALRAPDGRMIDGLHRLAEDPDWPVKVLSHIDTERKFWAARLASNFNRRVMPREETALCLKNLAEAIKEETGTTSGIIKQIVEDTGIYESTVRSLLREEEEKTGEDLGLTRQRRKSSTKDEEAPAPSSEEVVSSVSTPKMPGRDTGKFQVQVMETISRLVGVSIDRMVARMTTAHDLSAEEAEGYILSWKMNNRDLWNTMYNPDDTVKKTPATASSVEEAPTSQPPEGLSFSKDDRLIAAMKWYPDEVVNAIWNEVGQPTMRLPFLRQFFVVCFEMAKEAHPLEELMNIVYAQM